MCRPGPGCPGTGRRPCRGRAGCPAGHQTGPRRRQSGSRGSSRRGMLVEWGVRESGEPCWAASNGAGVRQGAWFWKQCRVLGCCLGSCFNATGAQGQACAWMGPALQAQRVPLLARWQAGWLLTCAVTHRLPAANLGLGCVGHLQVCLREGGAGLVRLAPLGGVGCEAAGPLRTSCIHAYIIT